MKLVSFILLCALSGFAQSTNPFVNVRAWGNNTNGETNVPPDLTNAVAISAGSYHSLALKADGSVVGWGYNGDGQTVIPVSATNVVAIAAGYQCSLASKPDGTVIGWGANPFGEANGAAAGSNVVAIAAGYAYSRSSQKFLSFSARPRYVVVSGKHSFA